MVLGDGLSPGAPGPGPLSLGEVRRFHSREENVSPTSANSCPSPGHVRNCAQVAFRDPPFSLDPSPLPLESLLMPRPGDRPSPHLLPPTSDPGETVLCYFVPVSSPAEGGPWGVQCMHDKELDTARGL